MQAKPVTSLPVRLEAHSLRAHVLASGWAPIGWTVIRVDDATAAARFFVDCADAEMPCWKRMEVVDGKLMQVR